MRKFAFAMALITSACFAGSFWVAQHELPVTVFFPDSPDPVHGDLELIRPTSLGASCTAALVAAGNFFYDVVLHAPAPDRYGLLGGSIVGVGLLGVLNYWMRPIELTTERGTVTVATDPWFGLKAKLKALVRGGRIRAQLADKKWIEEYPEAVVLYLGHEDHLTGFQIDAAYATLRAPQTDTDTDKSETLTFNLGHRGVRVVQAYPDPIR